MIKISKTKLEASLSIPKQQNSNKISVEKYMVLWFYLQCNGDKGKTTDL